MKLKAEHEIRAVIIHFLCSEVFGGGIVCGMVSSQVSLNRGIFPFFSLLFSLEVGCISSSLSMIVADTQIIWAD